jgi:hypothetical protein
MAHDPTRHTDEPAGSESMWTTALWTGGALAVVAGIAVYAGLSG